MNKYERVKTVLQGDVPDQVPVGFWYHNACALDAKEHVNAHLDLYHQTDMDVVKLMYDHGYGLKQTINSASDWYNIKPLGKRCAYYKKQADVLKGVLDGVQGDCMVWVTMFSPIKFATIAESDAMVMAHCRENPQAMLAGLDALADSLEEWARGFLEIGADAIYYSAQFGEPGRFTKGEWARFVKPYDVRLLKIPKEFENKHSILHLCGEPEYAFEVHIDRYGDYPGDMINWAIHANRYGLARGKELFARPILGGLDNRGEMAGGGAEEIREKAYGAIGEHGMAGFMLGADCSILGKRYEGQIKMAVQAARTYRREENK